MKQMNYSEEENQLVQGKKMETFFFPNSSEKGAFLLGRGGQARSKISPHSHTLF